MLRTRSLTSALRTGWGGALGLGLALCAVAAPALAQSTGESTYDIGKVYPDSFAVMYPPWAYRPADDETVRPGGDAAGMGGAYLARAEGPIAVGWEPAGLASTDHAALVIDGLARASSSSVPAYPDSFNLSGIGSLLITSYQSKLKGNLNANFIGLGLPVFENGSFRVAGALSWRRYLDLTASGQVLSNMTIRSQANITPAIYSLNRSEKGGVEAFAPTVAVQLFPGLAFGANFNVLTGSLNSSVVQRISYGVFPIESRLKLDYKYSGFVPDLGVRLQGLDQRIQVAARYSPAYILKVRQGTFSSRIPAQGTILYPYTVVGTVPDYDLKAPASLGIGLAIAASPDLSFAFDFDQHKWSQTTFTYRTPSARLESLGKPSYPLQDVTSFHVGGEYVLMRRPWGELPVRLGFERVPLSYRQVDRNDLAVTTDSLGDVESVKIGSGWNGKQIKPNAFTLGASLRLKEVTYDFGLERISYDGTAWFFDVPYDATVNPEMSLVTVKQTLTYLRLSATYHL